MTLIGSNIFQKTIDSTQSLILELNLRGGLRVPIQKPKFSDPQKFLNPKKIIFLIGEQHQGGSFKNIHFAQSNRSLTELVLRLIENPKLKIKNFFKEGLSEIKFHPELEIISKENFITNHTHPLVTALHLNKNQINIHNCESKNLFIKFALLSLLYCSLPHISKMPEQEIFRIKNLLNYYEDNDEISKIIESESKFLIDKFRLKYYQEKKILKKIFINSTEFFCFNNQIKQILEIDNLKFLIQAELKKQLLLRDQVISQKLLESQFESCVLLIGDLHLTNLKTLLEQVQIPVISISIFL
ncbi:MAG: hypothetical protein RLZZ361_915 [Cyanobacteriota bacterium]|jgi:hypothetical protein